MATAIRAALVDWRNYLIGMFTQFVANPVIGRELRVRVRLRRGYLLQAAYLAFMVLIVALAYQSVVGDANNLRNPFDLQNALVEFYRIVLGTLIALVVLIAPALTANALTLERERKTIELLLATPLTARQLLTGKLVGSFAFVILLLALTMPVSAVCVLMGGTSFGDLIRAYVIVAFSTATLCAIALFTSVYARNSTLAVLWSYGRVGAFLLFTMVLVALQDMYGRSAGSGAGVRLLFPVALFNPFAALFAADTELDMVYFKLPSWAVAVIINLLLTRLLLTGAARKVGLYDKDVMPSLRRQVLFLAPLWIVLNFVPVLALGGLTGLGVRAIGRPEAVMLIALGVAPILALAAWISPFGKDEDKECHDDGVFRLSKMFSPAPSGALPFLLTVWLLMIGALIGSFAWTRLLTALDLAFWEFMGALIFYFTGVWVLFWGVGRACSALLRGRSLSGARALAITILTALTVLPVFVHLLFYVYPYDSVALNVWLWMPFFEAISSPISADVPTRLFLWGSATLLLGAILGAFTSKRASRVLLKPQD
ncbi:MAG: ABC transporter permease subunit [Armatimonadota bacterium]|nr:ABC transporter permease subunit [Armatimonadota bacterium]MDW8107459.1 ABC transporter permease subunit [Armatimonadota bacterium]